MYIMEKLFAEIFYNPRTGYSGFAPFYENVKRAAPDLKITQAAARKWYNSQETNQMVSKKQKSQNKIYAETIGRLVADLIDVRSWETKNSGVKYLLTVIDIHTRRAWAWPLKSKKPEAIAIHIKEVLDEVFKKREQTMSRPISFTSDEGGEFLGDVERVLAKNNVKHWTANPELNTKRRTAHIESFNKTLLNKLRKLMLSRNKYIDQLDDIIIGYNNTKHSVTKETPMDIWNGVVKSQEVAPDPVDVLPIGSKVRFELKRETFTKASRAPVFSHNVYTIEKHVGNLYFLKGIKKPYLAHQLLVVGHADEVGDVGGVDDVDDVVEAVEADDVDEADEVYEADVVPEISPAAQFITDMEEQRVRSNFDRRQRRGMADGHEAHYVNGRLVNKDRITAKEGTKRVPKPNPKYKT